MSDMDLSLQRRRIREAERRERIFNEKWMAMGVDKEALDQQVKEKEKKEEAEKEEEHAYHVCMLHIDEAAVHLERREAEERRAIEKAIVDYRHRYQQPRSEDPRSAQKILPGLLGEDPDGEIRHQRQCEQLREWLIQQQHQQAAERHQQKLEEHHDYLSRAYMTNKELWLQSTEMERRKEAVIATTEYNLAMAAEKHRQERDDKAKLTGAEVKPTLGVPGTCPGTDRKAPPESLQQVVQFQTYQREEKKRVELMKKQEVEQQNRDCLASVRTDLLRQRQQARLNKQLRQHQDSTNIKLAETHKQQKPDIDRGHIDDSFFSQFNTCSR